MSDTDTDGLRTKAETADRLAALDQLERGVNAELAQWRQQLEALNAKYRAQHERLVAAVDKQVWDEELFRTLKTPSDEEQEEVGVLKTLIANFTEFKKELERLRAEQAEV